MADCTLNMEFPMGSCYESSGGISKVYFAAFDDVQEVGPIFGSVDDDGLIIGITMSGTASFFYDYTPYMFTGNVKFTPAEGSMGTQGYDIEFSLPFQKNEADTRNAVKMLRKTTVICLYKDANDVWILLGEEYGLRISPSYDSGTKMIDDNKWTFICKGTETKEPREVDPDIVNALIYVAP